jgi:hypothetical protein
MPDANLSAIELIGLSDSGKVLVMEIEVIVLMPFTVPVNQDWDTIPEVSLPMERGSVLGEV